MTYSEAEHATRVLKRVIYCVVGAEQVAKRIYRLHGDKIEPLWLVLVGGGLRVKEVLVLWWDDIKFSPITHIDGTEDLIAHASITKAWTEKDGLKATMNAFSTRIVPIPDPFASKLYEQAVIGPRTPVWPIYPGRSRKWWRNLFEKDKPLYGMPYTRMKDMRSVHETMLQDAGVLDTLNARIHGRTNVQTGYTHYLKPSAAMDNSVDALRIKMQNIG